MGFLPLPSSGQTLGPIGDSGSLQCARHFGAKCGHACCCQVGTQVTRKGVAWKLGQRKGPPTKRSLTSCKFQQVLVQIWGPKPSWACSSGHCPKTQLGNVKEAVSRKCFTMRLCVGGISHVTVTHKPESL